ncbi:MAG: NAD+ synthase [Xanthomonadales bacterium]|nr:NAD+ synthase [Xanthomonadales bacterium]
MKLAFAQHDFAVGALSANLRLAIDCVGRARQESVSLVIFPELAITGYPPEDLLLRPGFMRQTHDALEALLPHVTGIDVLIGHPWMEEGKRFNAASWIRDGQVIGRYYKQCLPNYAVFDERRYFSPGASPLVQELGGVHFGVIICEDAWERGPAQQALGAGAQCLLVPNASPYRDDKHAARLSMLQQRHADCGLPLAYCNLVGGQDELVFDGRSLVMNADGSVAGAGPVCKEALLRFSFVADEGRFECHDWPQETLSLEAEIYRALVQGLRDYTLKNGFREVVLGLSGGVDSALTLAIAVDALGAAQVHAVMLPSAHTSDMSLELARQQAELLDVDYRIIEIGAVCEALEQGLSASFGGVAPDVTEENLQARVRGNFIMALSNKFGWLPLATSNKSELAVGYSTIYGDMCGGFSPIKDCLKTRVYDLCHYRNTVSPAIPEQVISRAPTAELAPGQTDQDSLPPYSELDDILRRFVDLDQSIADIVASGHDEEVVRKVAGMVLRNEYKRRQGAPGTRITSRGFGRDRRYPITSGWRESGSSINPNR